MQDIQTTLDTLFDFSSVRIDTKKNLHTPIRERIYELLTPAYFRLGTVDEELENILRTRIDRSVSANQPITLIIAYGGFKNIHIDAAPHIDWAEVFQLSFVLKTVWEITQIYEPGVHVEYSGDAEAMSVVDNLKIEWIETYLQEFATMLRVVQSALPSNLKITNKDFKEFYTPEWLAEELDGRFARVDFNVRDIQGLVSAHMPKATNNYCWDGERDLTNLPELEKQKILEKSIVLHKLWLELDYEYRGEYLEGGIHIPIAHRKGLPGCFGIKSIAGSDVQFWIAKGVLTQKDGRVSPTLLSAQAYTKVKEQVVDISVTSTFETLPFLRSVSVISGSTL